MKVTVHINLIDFWKKLKFSSLVTSLEIITGCSFVIFKLFV